MRVFLFILILLAAAAGGYGYVNNPGGCKKLGDDLKTDLTAIFSPTTGTASAGAPAAPAAAEVAEAPARAPWVSPTVIPSQPHWTWTTSQGIFTEVRILKVEPDCVTIADSEGGALVPVAELPPDLQKQLNYDPVEAKLAAARRAGEDQASAQALAQERSVQAAQAPFEEMTDYSGALARAKSSGKLVLLHFTGSDWCPYCKDLESEVLSTPAFQQYSAANYIFVTLDFPHDLPLPETLKEQNAALQQKYNVHGFPTLLVIDSNEKEIGRTSGYDPGSGPAAVIAELKGFGH